MNEKIHVKDEEFSNILAVITAAMNDFAEANEEMKKQFNKLVEARHISRLRKSNVAEYIKENTANYNDIIDSHKVLTDDAEIAILNINNYSVGGDFYSGPYAFSYDPIEPTRAPQLSSDNDANYDEEEAEITTNQNSPYQTYSNNNPFFDKAEETIEVVEFDNEIDLNNAKEILLDKDEDIVTDFNQEKTSSSLFSNIIPNSESLYTQSQKAFEEVKDNLKGLFGDEKIPVVNFDTIEAYDKSENLAMQIIDPTIPNIIDIPDDVSVNNKKDIIGKTTGALAGALAVGATADGTYSYVKNKKKKEKSEDEDGYVYEYEDNDDLSKNEEF